MTLEKSHNSLENKFWNFAIKFMKEDGFLTKALQWISRVVHSRAGHYSLCLLVWAAVGFLFGLVLGKIYWFFQFF